MNSILEYSHPYPPAKSTFRSRSHSASSSSSSSSSEAADAAAEEQLCPTSDNVLEELSERQEVAPHAESEHPVVKSSANGDGSQEEEEEPSTLSKVQGLLKSRHSSKSSVASSSEDEEAEDKRVNHPVPEDFVQVVPDTTHGKETAKS